MKTRLLLLLIGSILLLIPKLNFGQAPTLGTTSGFALFTAVGAFTNDGASYVTGDIGTNVGEFTGFPPGTVVGEIHVADPVSVQAAIDVDVAYSALFATTCDVVIGTTLGNGQVLSPNVYCLGAASTLTGDLILDGQDNPDALFIIKIDGALSTSTYSNVILINSASLCNVYWQINGFFDLGENATFSGTVIANGAITLLEGSSLSGRGLSRGGAIALHNNVVTIGSLPEAATITAEGATTFCEGESVTISGNIDGTWNTGATTASITVSASGDYYVTNTNGCGSVTSNHIIVTVNPLPTAATITADGATAFCEGESVTLSGNINGIWSTGATTASITVSASGDYYVTNTNDCGTVTSNHIIVSTDVPPIASIITAGGETTFCEGARVKLYGNIGGVWNTGATTDSIIVSVSGDYYVTNSNSCGSVTSNHIIVTVNPLPVASIITAGGETTFCEGANVILSGNVGGVWNTGATTASITVTTSGDYFVINTNNCGTVTSNHIVVTVNPLPVASVITADGSTTFCEGENVMLSGNVGGVWNTGETTASITVAESGDYFVTNANDCGSATSNHILVTVNPLPDATTGSDNAICVGNSVTLGASPISGHTYLWIPATGLSSAVIANPVASPVVTTTYTLTETVTATACQNSNAVTVTVNTAPFITVEPSDQTACVGSSVSFTITATGTDLTYQWSKGSVILTDGENISGSNAATLVINPVTLSDTASNYHVTITGICSPDVTSIDVSLIVNAAPVISTVVCVGGSVSFSATATGGTDLTYQWRKGSVNLVNGGNISGATSATLIINPVTLSDVSPNYNVVINGVCEIYENSINISLIVNPLPTPAITGLSSVCLGTTGVVYTTESSMTGYNWTISPGGTITSGSGTNAITVSWETEGNQSVSVNYSNDLGCDALTPYVFYVNVENVPTAAGTISGSASVCVGTTGNVYSIPAIANATSYLWTVPTGATIVSGDGTNAITVDFSTTASSGIIAVNGLNNCGNGPVSPVFEVVLNLIPATPVITQISDTLISNSSLGNQWYLDGVAISGATAMQLVVSYTGSYYVVVTVNECSSSPSNTILVQTVSVAENGVNNTFDVYPNPNNGLFTIKVATVDPSKVNIEILNSLGELQWKQEKISVNGTFTRTVDFTGAPAGVYMVVLNNKETSITRKILIVK
ncbi:MAG: DUF3494 domain-containing protein [Bacteroidales bacterium]|nr:DUF3494 domain-containing protein [Bacteroidales bacterium]